MAFQFVHIAFPERRGANASPEFCARTFFFIHFGCFGRLPCGEAGGLCDARGQALSAEFCDGRVDHIRAFANLRHIVFRQGIQRLPHAAAENLLPQRKNFLDDRVQIAPAGAHDGNNFVDGVLRLLRTRKIAREKQLVHFQKQRGHHAVGSADAAVRAEGPPGDKLLVRAVEK